jgi:hypothetical protein
MLEHGISQETLHKETRLRRLMTFMKDYETGRMDGDRIIGYLKELDEAMNRVPISESIRSELSMESVQKKRINVLSFGEHTPFWILLLRSAGADPAIARWRFQRASGVIYSRRDLITTCVRYQIK